MSKTIAATLARVISKEDAAKLVGTADNATLKNLEIIAGGIRSGADPKKIKLALLNMMPAEEDETDSELDALLKQYAKPAKPTKPASKPAKPSKASKPARSASKAKLERKQPKTAGRIDWTGQPPISASTGNPLPWIVDAAESSSTGDTYFNIGRKGYGRSIGATLEVWREVLSNADELLADLEDFAEIFN